MHLFRFCLIPIIVLCATPLLAPASAQENEIELPAITEIVRKYFPEDSDGGLALLVVKDKSAIHRKGYGLENGDVRISPQTRMPLASVTKQFAAMCAAILIEEGQLNLTDKVSKYLPEIQFSDAHRELLIQDLVWHTSGLPNFIKAEEKESIAKYKKANKLSFLSNKTHAEWLTTTKLRRPPGTEFEYTNSGYVLLARVIEVITEKPFHEFQRERIFVPLEMTNTTDSKRFNGSGNMTTTLEDYQKWDRALWDQSLLNEETSRLVFQQGTLDNGETVDYGFGWRITHDGKELLEVFHGGVGSPPRSARNLIARDIKNKVTVALFIRENLTLNKTERRALVDEIKSVAIGAQ